jgi:hypothetical protein
MTLSQRGHLLHREDRDQDQRGEHQGQYGIDQQAEQGNCVPKEKHAPTSTSVQRWTHGLTISLAVDSNVRQLHGGGSVCGSRIGTAIPDMPQSHSRQVRWPLR